MYNIKDGILYKDGKKTFVLGQSYYPSFHPNKCPVPPEGDRIGEMKKDLKGMVDAGFNHVRFAALGGCVFDKDGELKPNTDFIDKMCIEAGKCGISVSIREQGMSVNLRDHKDAEMIDWNGENPTFAWYDFVRTTLNHEGILEDNRMLSKVLSEHFAKYESVVGFQIYNEPKHPRVTITFLDYRDSTIKAYRKWLVDKNLMTEKEASDYNPPRRRNEQTDEMWAYWRLFSRDNLTAFLNNASDGSKEGSDLPTFTCYTTSQIAAYNTYAGDDMFGNAFGMDVVGYTTYIHANGVGYYPMSLQADLAQCAAEAQNKQSWCIELDSRTYIPLSVYNRGTYTILGAGCKGIVYYQWRGDCPMPGTPEANSCGILNYDGTKTANFDNAVNVNKFILGLNDLIIGANRSHCGVGILHSDYAAFLCDARENHNIEQRIAPVDGVKPEETFANRYVLEYSEIYRKLREAGYTVSIIDGTYPDENPFDIKVLYVPHMHMLSKSERAKVELLKAKGVRVFENSFTDSSTMCICFKEYGRVLKDRKDIMFEPCLSVWDVADITGIKPLVSPLGHDFGVQTLCGDGYKLVVVTNISAYKEKIDVKLSVNVPFKSAEFRAFDGNKEISLDKDQIVIKDVTDGGILILKD